MRGNVYRLLPAAAAALALAGCGSSGSTGGGTSPSHGSKTATVSGNEIARAADVSSKATGFQMKLTLHESGGSLGTGISGTGTGAFNVPQHAGSMTLNMSLPASLGAAGNLTMHEVLQGKTIYMELPSTLSSKLPGGKPWIELDLSKLGSGSGLGSLGALTGGAGSSNPAQFLTYLSATSANGIKNLGSATVDGMQTTHYRGVIDLSKAAGAAPSAARAAVTKALAQLQKLTTLSQIPVNVYVDSQNLVRRLAMTYSAKVSGQPLTTAMTIDFTSYGAQPVPTTPPASQVTNLSALLSSVGG